jgi:hypothetical protein
MSRLSDYIDQNPDETKRLIGVDYELLQNLIGQAKTIHRQQQDRIEKDKVRLIARGGGRKATLSNRDELLLTLTYLRQHHTFQWLGLQFGVCESTAHYLFHYWIAVLEDLLPASILEQVKDQESDYEYVKEILTEFELIVDTTEQPRQRPEDKEEQEDYYSGYKHMHTFKGQIIILPKGKDIVDLVAGEMGPKHDLTLFREHQDKFDSQQRFNGDKSYAGEPTISIPHKKSKNRDLTEAQKRDNKVLSGQRIFVEHVIRLIKIFRIAQDRFRLRTSRYKQVIHTICGLVRLRIRALILAIEESVEIGIRNDCSEQPIF